MGVGGVLDAGVSLARGHYGSLVTVAAWGIVPPYFVATLLYLFLPGGGLDGIAGLITGIANFLTSAALALALARLLDPSSTSDELTVRALYKAARRRFWSIIGLGIVTGLAAIPLIIVFPLGIYVLVRWSVSWVTVVVEGDGAIEGIKRSWELTGGAWWHTLVVASGAVLLVAVLQILVGGIFAVVGGNRSLMLGSEALSTILVQIGNVLST